MDPRIDALLELLAHHRSEVVDAYATVPEEHRHTSPGEGRWSVAQVVGHLGETERDVTKLLAGFARGAAPRDAGESWDEDVFRRRISMDFFLDRSRKIQGSDPTEGVAAAEAWETLEKSRERLLEALEGVRGLRLETTGYPHPLIGMELDGYQWVAFLALHEGRHAAQIREIAEELA